MNLVSWILVGIALVLFIGILILEWTKPKQKASASTTSMPRMENATMDSWPRLMAVEQKIEMAHDRLQRVENILSKIPLETVEKKLDTKEILQKLNMLLDSHAQTKTEIAELKTQIQKQNTRQESLASISRLENELAKQRSGLTGLQKQPTSNTRRTSKRKK